MVILFRSVEVLVTSNEQEINRWVTENVYSSTSSFKDSNRPSSAIRANRVVGFDIEWKPSFVRNTYNPTAIIQVSTLTSILVAQVIGYKTLPDSLSQMLTDENCAKVGVVVSDDLEKVQKDFDVRYKVHHT